MGAEYPDFPHHTQIFEWLNRYADAFGLRERIRFRTSVVAAERLAGGGWTLRTGDGREHRFDVLLVCNGHHWDPRVPDRPRAVHRADTAFAPLHRPERAAGPRGKRVLVVGIGNSAVDIVSEISRPGVAANIFISTRSGAWVMPKYVFGRPLDTVVKTNPRVPLRLQRRIAGLAQRIVSGNPESSGSPAPITVSWKLTRPCRARSCSASGRATRPRSRTSPNCKASGSVSPTARSSRST